MESELNELKRKVESNIETASLIGEGRLEQIVAGDDKMAQTLLQMGQKLKENKVKEDSLQWITKGKEILNDTLRSHNDLDSLSRGVVKLIVDYTKAVQGTIFLLDNGDVLRNVSTYAYNRYRYLNQEISIGKGLIGQVAYEKQMIHRTELPDDYCSISSGLLGDAKPKSIIIIPLARGGVAGST